MLSKKLISLSSIYVLLCLILVSLYTFIYTEVPPLLKSDIVLYKIFNSFSNFLAILPSIIIAVFLVVIATYINKAPKPQIRIFQKLLLQIGVIVCLLFCSTEILEPLLFKSKTNLQNKYINYNWYIQKSTESYENDINMALYYLESAIKLNPEIEEESDLEELYKNKLATEPQKTIEYFPELSKENLETIPKDMSVYSLLEKSRIAYKNKNYLDAHYYATIGLELGTMNNPNSPELQKIARDAWNEISTYSGFETDIDMDIFSIKREGYSALISGDALTAYYTFLDLWNNNPYDPDISRYYTVSKEALLNQYFFLDECKNLTHFENSKNVTFTITRKDGITYDIAIGGITNVNDTGMYLKYLRDYTCTIRNSTGTIIADFFVPYAKLIGEPLSSFNNDVINTLGFDTNTIVPRLLLTSVDRKTQGVLSEPTVTSGTISMLDEIVTLLPMPLEDIELIIEATTGPQYINLASLYKFIPKANDYGFNEQIFSSYFIKRISYPFLLFTIFLIALIFAWNYRLQQDCVFRAYWLLIIPACTVFFEISRIFIEYLNNLIALFCADFNNYIKIPIIIAFFSVLIVSLSMRFLFLMKKSIINEK